MSNEPATFGRTSLRVPNPATAGQVFRLIRTGEATTRTEVGRLTGLSRTAVAARVAALVELGLIRETEEAASGVGRPPTRLAFDASAGVVLCAAVGRSRTQVAVCDLAGEPLARQDIQQEVGPAPDELMPRVVGALRDVLRHARRPARDVRGIGISIPGTVNGPGRCSQDSPIMAGWHAVPLDPYFAALADAPVFLENDTNVIALAERSGHLLHYRDALIVKASTGFGAGIVSGGAIQHGALGAAGEIGHVKYAAARQVPCRCGEVGCLEAVAGGWALVRNMRDKGHEVGHTRDVVELALGGNTDARREIRRSGRHFGEVLAAAVTLLNPAAIVIGGDMAPAYDLFVAGMRETLYRDASALATRDLRILSASYGDQSGVRGCAELALDQVLSDATIDQAVLAHSPLDVSAAGAGSARAGTR
jgi:predicted NBD/HSP70 family sugar kinase